MTQMDDDQRKLISDLFAESHTEIRADDLNAAETVELLSALENLSGEGPKDGAGELSVIAGRYSIRISRLVWSLTQAFVSLALAVAGPEVLNKVGAAKIAWDAIKTLKNVVRELTASEVQVCEAIAAKGGEHWRARGDKLVSGDDIRAYFKARETLGVRGLESVLASLVKKDAISEEVDLETDAKTYRIAF